MANLQNMIKQMHVEELTASIDRKALTRIQSHLGEIQATVGKLQSEMATQ